MGMDMHMRSPSMPAWRACTRGGGQPLERRLAGIAALADRTQQGLVREAEAILAARLREPHGERAASTGAGVRQQAVADEDRHEHHA